MPPASVEEVFASHEAGCRLRDEIEYAPPPGWLGRLGDPIAVRPKLVKLFDYRPEITLREVIAARKR